MKAFRSFLAVSAIVSVTQSASATVWDITMTENTFVSPLLGPLIMNLSGTYDDAATWTDSSGVERRGVADVGGHIDIPGFLTSVDYTSILFNMDFATGYGYLNSPDPSSANCQSNISVGCLGVSQGLNAPLYNNIAFSFSNESWGQKNTSTANSFIPASGAYTWTAVASVPLANGQVRVYEIPFLVTLLGGDTTPDYPDDPVSVPEPHALSLILAGLFGIYISRYRK